MYPQSVLDDIRDRVSIAALIGERVPLKKAGRNYKGCCPFHNEKTPSFVVSDEKRIYHCFGCGEGGNVFNFFMKFDGLSFRESVEMLASRAGVRLPVLGTADKRKDDELSQKKRLSYRVNQIVAEYFNRNLKDPKKGEAARNYLESRGIFLEKNEQLFLGYAEDSWDGLVRHLREKKVPLDLAAELGVVKKRADGGYYDFFRHRVICPVIMPGPGGEQRVVAFSGRTFGRPRTAEGREEPAKYINSPESLIYHKSYTVYGLGDAIDAIRKEDRVIFVEGNLDVVRLHQEGMANSVAPLGTALTSGHLRLLGRFTKNFVVIFDGDEAGYKAAARSLPVFLEEGAVPRMVALQNGEDPDSFVRENGPDALRRLIEGSGTLFEWLIDITAARRGKGTDGKVKVVEELKPLFSMLRNPVETALYRKRLAASLGLEEAVIAASLSGRKLEIKEGAVRASGNRAERMLLEVLLTYPETMAEVAGVIGPEDFSDGSYQTIARLILDEFGQNGRIDVGRLSGIIADEELRSEVLALAMADNKYEEPALAVKDCLKSIRRSAARRRLQELSEKMTATKDDAQLASLMKEVQEINRELHDLI